MASEEHIKLILEMKGNESVAALNKSLDDQKKELQDLAAAWNRGEMSANEYLQTQNQLQAEVAETNRVLMQLKGTGAGGAGGQGVMAMSYAFQDFTSQIQNGFGPALASIQNNIPGMLIGTGLSNPMIAAISAISVGIGLIAPQIIKAFGQESQKEIDAAKEKLKEFEAEVKKVHEAFEKMREKPTSKEDEFTENMKAIFEAPGNAELIRKAILTSLAPAIPIGMTDEEIEAHAAAAGKKKDVEFEPGGAAQATQRMRDWLIQQRTALRTQEQEGRAFEAENIMKQVLAPGPAQASALFKLKQVPLPEKLSREMTGILPEVMEAADKAQAERDAGIQRAIDAGEQRKKKRKNEREAFAEAARFHQQLDAERDQHEEHAEEAGEQGAKDLQGIAHAGRRRAEQRQIAGMRHQQQQAAAAARRGMSQEHREAEERNADVERAINEGNEAAIEGARARGESRQVIEAMLNRARLERQEAAAERRFWSRQMQREEQTVMGGGNQ